MWPKYPRGLMTREDIEHFRATASRPRDLVSLSTYVLEWESDLEQSSYDAKFQAGMCAALDETKMVIAAIPARSIAEYSLKMHVLSGVTSGSSGEIDGVAPLTPAHALLPVLARASLLADELNLGLKKPPKQVASNVRNKERNNG